MRERPEALTVVCGEALVDLFVAVGADGQLRSVPRLGGAPYNLAVGLARLGADVALCAGLSTDFFGAALRRGLEAEGVSAEFLEEFAEPTMLVVIGRQSDGRPSYGFPVKISADRQLTGRRFHEAHAPVDTLVLGSHLLVLPETQQRLLGILTDIRPDTLICLDPNVRLGIIPDGRLWLDAIEKFLPYADIIKASDEDIAALYPDATIDDVASAWRDNGAGLVVVTFGASGATAWFGDRQKLDVPGESVNVIDTVGAGDSFFAAFLVSLREQKLLTRTSIARLDPAPLARAMRFSIAAASITCSRLGADLPNRQAVMAHLGQRQSVADNLKGLQ